MKKNRLILLVMFVSFIALKCDKSDEKINPLTIKRQTILLDKNTAVG